MSRFERYHRIPKALWPWDNQARLSLPPVLAVWLLLLVSTVLASLCFVRFSFAAVCVISGFIVSHIFVFAFSVHPGVKLRRGLVSLLHVICWSPGLVVVAGEVYQWFTHPGAFTADMGTGFFENLYPYWLGAYALLALVSLFFDLRDSARYLGYLLSRSSNRLLSS